MDFNPPVVDSQAISKLLGAEGPECGAALTSASHPLLPFSLGPALISGFDVESALSGLTNAERAAMEVICEHLADDQRRQVLAQLRSFDVEVVNEDRSLLRFTGAGQSLAPGQQPIWPEGKVQDADGELLDVVLYQDANGHLLAFELVRYAQGPVQGPDWTTLKVYS